MTITLAAVYAPVGIQGGLTGALFREFAFTLAGAVIVSGVVALTLSPMMGAKLLRAGTPSAALPAGSTAASTACATRYTRTLTGTLRYRPVVLVLWVIVALLMVPFYMFSQRELAPSRGPGRRVLDPSGVRELHASIRRSCSPSRSHDVYRSFPETASIFQLTFPTGGFGGMVTKPWSERTKTTEQLLMEIDGAAVADPGHSRDSADAAAAARRRRLSGGPRDRVGRPSRSSSASSRTSSCRRRSRAACSSLPTPI